MSDIFKKRLDSDNIPMVLGLDEREGYGAMPLRNLSVGWEVPFDIFLKIKKKGEHKLQFVKSCAKGEVFRKDWHQKLIQLKIPSIYVSMQELDRVMDYLDYHLNLLLKDEKQSEVEKGVRVCDATHLWMVRFFHREEARTGEQINLAFKFLDVLFDSIKGDRHNLTLLMEIRRAGARLFSHCLNVCLLGLAFTAYLGWDRQKVKWFGIGALLHDIGLTRTPLSILEKRGKLSADEMSKIKRHPLDGFRMLQIHGFMSWEALQMVLQHHENGDGSGYPGGLLITEVKTWSRILRILDSYEAMTNERPWREAMEPKEALWTMRSDWEKDKIFDRNYLKAFVKFLAG